MAQGRRNTLPVPDIVNVPLSFPAAAQPPVGADDFVSARQWLAQAAGDDAAMATLRLSALSLSDGIDISRLDDQQLIEQLAPALAAGRLPGLGPTRTAAMYKLVLARPPAPPPPPPVPSSRPAAASPAAAPAEAETTFGSELDVAAMVAVLVQAAQDGMPFCAECAKAAARVAAEPAA